MLKKALSAIFGNFRLKLMALIISVGIWFYADNRLAQEAPVTASLEINPPPGYVLFFQDERSARMQIVGPRSLVSRLQLAQNYLRLTRNLTEHDLKDGWAALRVEPDWLLPNLPEREFIQLKFRSILPATVRVFASPSEKRLMPVEVKASGDPPPGFRLLEPVSVSPSEVEVTGPAVALDALSAIATEELPLWNVRTDSHLPLALQNQVEVVLDDGTRATATLKLTPARVVARVYVTGEPEEQRTFEGLLVVPMQPPGFPYEAQLVEGEARVTVTVSASPENLRKLQPESVKAYVNLSALASEQIPVGGSALYPEPVRVQLPPDVTYSTARADPVRVTLRLNNPAE